MKDQSKKHYDKTSAGSKAEEVSVPYDTNPKIYTPTNKSVKLNDFGYSSFKVILDKSPFTIGEWAQLLYMSERTLHRYAKEQAAFNGLQIERILLLEELVDTGIDLLGKDGLKQWVHSYPFSFDGARVFDCLYTHHGIQASLDMLQRAQHGIPA